MTGEVKKTMTREKHPGRVTHGHKLAALMKKRKGEILRSKEQCSVQSTEQSSVQPTEKPSAQSTVQSSDTYIYGAGILAVLAIGACVFFAYNTFQPKKLINEKKDQQPKRCHTL